MIFADLVTLAEQFRRLELHAARGGREVLRALLAAAVQSRAQTSQELRDEIRDCAAVLLPALPPYAPPYNNINRILVTLDRAVEAGLGVEQAKTELQACGAGTADPAENARRITAHLEREIPGRAVVYTHTLSETILNALLEMHRRGKLDRVLVTESRPNNDGWDTARRLAGEGVGVELTIDAAMPSVIEKAQVMLSGAEMIARDGSVIGKIGAYPAAVLCGLAQKPVYIVADSGKAGPFERADFHFTPLGAEDLGLPAADAFIKVTGSYFDMTPARYIRAYVTERGVYTAETIGGLGADTPVSAWLKERLRAGPSLIFPGKEA